MLSALLSLALINQCTNGQCANGYFVGVPSYTVPAVTYTPPVYLPPTATYHVPPGSAVATPGQVITVPPGGQPATVTRYARRGLFGWRWSW